MSSRIEQLLIKSVTRENGWGKIHDTILNIDYRSFRIGNNVSCNDDLTKDYGLKSDISTILDSHNIQYILNEVDNTNNFSYQINVDEHNYELLKMKYN
jgi:hypothetical protein